MNNFKEKYYEYYERFVLPCSYYRAYTLCGAYIFYNNKEGKFNNSFQKTV